MRLTHLGTRLALAAVLAAQLAPLAGCRRMPYIDQSKVIPPDEAGRAAEEDAGVKQASYLQNLPMPLPKVLR